MFNKRQKSYNLFTCYNKELITEYKNTIVLPIFALVNDKIMGVDSEHDRNVICIKV